MALQITNPTNLTFTKNLLINYKFIATGGVAPYNFKTPSILPAGLTLTLKGFLKGRPTTKTSFSLRLKAISSNGKSIVKVFTITIANPTTTKKPTTTKSPTTTAMPNTVCYDSWGMLGIIGEYDITTAITSDLIGFTRPTICGLFYLSTLNAYCITFSENPVSGPFIYSVKGLQVGNTITLPNLWKDLTIGGPYPDVSGTYNLTEIRYNLTDSSENLFQEYAVLSCITTTTTTTTTPIPINSNLYVTSYGDNYISDYDRNISTGELTLNSSLHSGSATYGICISKFMTEMFLLEL